MINPVLEKEFRLRMRTVRSPVLLFAYLLAIGVLAFGYLYIRSAFTNTFRFDPEESRLMFYFLSASQLVLLSFLVPGLTAGAVSGEREKQTLNILLTTPQSSAAIALSKLAASLAFTALAVIATTPVYAVVFLYGGVSPRQLAAVFLFYLLVMLSLGSVGVACSTVLRRTVVSVVAAYGFVVFLYGFTAFFALLFGAMTKERWIAGLTLGLNPMAALVSMFESGLSEEMFRGTIVPWLRIEYLFVAYHVAIAAIGLTAAILRLRPR
ncbi:MAG: hypothetical protein BLM47_05480 [Candidatus Reconcilbacillus cellulovorans]|uniref:ABC transporter permease n=1 Tax=Candidatus Reconcilbacillus cellulovorans TaxID=1906605 RepID=A0A2A6E189_9BACL|nr:MAG: hypothetical protein BLM47_05480 [Candidatus Reconcilbacillus cellulovorans]